MKVKGTQTWALGTSEAQAGLAAQDRAVSTMTPSWRGWPPTPSPGIALKGILTITGLELWAENLVP